MVQHINWKLYMLVILNIGFYQNLRGQSVEYLDSMSISEKEKLEFIGSSQLKTSKMKTIVFLHGGPDHKAEWNKTISLLKNHTCLAMDMPGFGLTGQVPKGFDFSLASQVQYLNEWISKNVKSEEIILVGHDIGATLAMSWASENHNRVKGLLLMNTVTDRNFEWHKMAKIWGSPILGRLFMFFVSNKAFKRGFSKDFPELSDEDVESVANGLTKSSRKNLLTLFRKMTKPEYFNGWEEKLKLVTTQVSTTVLWGKNDPLVPESYAAKLGGNLVMIEDGGHWVPREHPELVVEEIEKLIDLNQQ